MPLSAPGRCPQCERSDLPLSLSLSLIPLSLSLPRRATELHPIPSYRTVVADAPGAIWTIPRMPLSVGGFSVSQLTPPPLYESVLEGKDPALTLTPGGSRRLEPHSRATGHPGGLDPGPHFSIEPLTPPPVYELGRAGLVFTFEGRLEPQ